MGLTLFIFIGTLLLLLLILFFIYKTEKKEKGNQPFAFSLIALGLIVLNWILFLTSTYAIIPHDISEIIFTPSWFIVSIIGFIAAFKEFKNNRIVAISIGGLSVVCFFLGLLSILIANM